MLLSHARRLLSAGKDIARNNDDKGSRRRSGSAGAEISPILPGILDCRVTWLSGV